MTTDGSDPGDLTGVPIAAPEGVPRSARALTVALLVTLLVGGIGIEAWPLTGWRLFSMSRDDTQTSWVLVAVDDAGSVRTVGLEELPLGYRTAEWPMSELPGASEQRREEVCQALLRRVVEVEPGTVELRISRDDARLAERDGEWTVQDDLHTLHTCTPDGEPGGSSS